METTCIQLIRVANREFRDFIEEVSRTGVGIAEHPLASRRLARIAMRLEQVGNLLGQRGRISGQAADFRWCLAEYVETLRRLRTALETIQYSLLVEGAHLENLRAHLQAARDWVATLRETS